MFTTIGSLLSVHSISRCCLFLNLLDRIPVFNDLTHLVKSEKIHGDIFGITGPDLMGMKGYEISPSYGSDELDLLFRLFPRSIQ